MKTLNSKIGHQVGETTGMSAEATIIELMKKIEKMEREMSKLKTSKGSSKKEVAMKVALEKGKKKMAAKRQRSVEKARAKEKQNLKTAVLENERWYVKEAARILETKKRRVAKLWKGYNEMLASSGVMDLVDKGKMFGKMRDINNLYFKRNFDKIEASYEESLKKLDKAKAERLVKKQTKVKETRAKEVKRAREVEREDIRKLKQSLGLKVSPSSRRDAEHTATTDISETKAATAVVKPESTIEMAVLESLTTEPKTDKGNAIKAGKKAVLRENRQPVCEAEVEKVLAGILGCN